MTRCEFGLGLRSSEASAVESELRQLMEALGRSISLNKLDLPDEFYPAHLAVALIDAVFRSQLQGGGQAVPAAERYCRRFGLARIRADRWAPPPAHDQETLGGLIKHFDELGLERMTDEVFQSRQRIAGSVLTSAECVLLAARELRRMGIDVLQEVSFRPPEAIDDVMQSLAGADECACRLFLTYVGDDDFVLGDKHVRSFVAHAIGRESVSGIHAEELVRQSAYELILSPRYVDHQIWRLAWSKRSSFA